MKSVQGRIIFDIPYTGYEEPIPQVLLTTLLVALQRERRTSDQFLIDYPEITVKHLREVS